MNDINICFYSRKEEFNDNILYQIFMMENTLNIKYNDFSQDYEEWRENFFQNLNTGCKVILFLSQIEQVILYSRYIEDENYDNFYIKNTHIIDEFKKNIGIGIKFYRVIMNLLSKSKMNYLRLSTNKKNEEMIKMFTNRKNFAVSEKIGDQNHITFSIKKEQFLKRDRNFIFDNNE